MLEGGGNWGNHDERQMQQKWLTTLSHGGGYQEMWKEKILGPKCNWKEGGLNAGGGWKFGKSTRGHEGLIILAMGLSAKSSGS